MQLKLLALTAASLSLSLNAQTWVEAGDAGDLPGTANVVSGCGMLTQIDGSFLASDVDMYQIVVTNPATFSATTVGGTTADTQLWMFDLNGFGISFNDDSVGLQSTLTGQFLSGPGPVLIAVSKYNRDAQDSVPQNLWNNSPFGTERQPDGPGAANALAGWAGTTSAGPLYSIFLTGASFVTPSQLTTLPNFVSNNGGAAGGAVYFKVDVLAANGVCIGGMSLNTSAAIGSAISASVHVHNSITDPFALTSANVTAANWTALGGLLGTSAGIDLPSPMYVTNGTNSINLAPGSYLLAVDACPNMAHRYTSGGPALQVVANADLQITAGRATNVEFTGTPFGSPTSARVTNVRLEYEAPSSPVTPTAGGYIYGCASVASVGTACGGAGAMVYELFDGTNAWDLSSNDVLFAAGGGTVATVAGPGTAIVPPVAPDLLLGDDNASPLIDVGFSFDAFGVCSSNISVCSNGSVFLGGVGNTTWTESATTMNSDPVARIAGYWDDLQPLNGGGASGTIHLDVNYGVSALITFSNVALWGSTTNFVTFQIELTATSALVRFDPTSPFASSSLVGFHNGAPQAAPPAASDLTGTVAPVTGAANLTLTAGAAPRLGSTFGMTLAGTPTIGGVLVEFGVLGAGTALPTPLFATGCTQYIGPNFVVLGLSGNCVQSYSIAIPAGPGFIGVNMALQGAALNGPANQFVASNGLNAKIGNL